MCCVLVLQAALKHGRPVMAEVSNTLADGLAVPMVRRAATDQRQQGWAWYLML